jgi:hypothetical protein
MSSQKSTMRNFTNCKIIMFKLQKHGFLNLVLGWNFNLLEFSIKMSLFLAGAPWGYLREARWIFIKKFKKLDFYASKKSISRNGYVMKGKTELLTNFSFFSIPMVERLQEEIQSLCNFSFLKIVKIEPVNKV